MKKREKPLELPHEKIGGECICAVLYFLCLPFTLAFVPIIDMSLLKLITYPLCAYFIATIFINNGKLKLNAMHVFVILYALYTFTDVLRGANSSWDDVRGILETSALLLLISTHVYNKREQQLILYTWMVVGLIMTSLGLASAVRLEDRVTIQVFGGSEDPNEFCGYFVLPMLLYMREFLRGGKLRFIYVIAFILGLYVVLSTGSRGGLIGVVAGVVAYAFVSVKGLTNRLKLLGLLVLAALVGYFVLFPMLPQSVQERFSVEAVLENHATGRFDLWEATYDSIVESDTSLILGHGVGSTSRILIEKGFVNTVSHNHWLQLWCDQGFIGMILFFMILVSGFLHNIKRRPYIAMALIGMLALSISLTLYAYYKPFWNVLIISAMSFTEDLGKEADNAR